MAKSSFKLEHDLEKRRAEASRIREKYLDRIPVVKENQILHKGSRVLDQECATLADLNIFPGDKLWVKDSEIHEHRDISDELADQKMSTRKAEGGFRGTLLTSNVSSQAVQDVCTK